MIDLPDVNSLGIGSLIAYAVGKEVKSYLKYKNNSNDQENHRIDLNEFVTTQKQHMEDQTTFQTRVLDKLASLDTRIALVENDIKHISKSIGE